MRMRKRCVVLCIRNFVRNIIISEHMETETWTEEMPAAAGEGGAGDAGENNSPDSDEEEAGKREFVAVTLNPLAHAKTFLPLPRRVRPNQRWWH